MLYFSFKNFEGFYLPFHGSCYILCHPKTLSCIMRQVSTLLNTFISSTFTRTQLQNRLLHVLFKTVKREFFSSFAFLAEAKSFFLLPCKSVYGISNRKSSVLSCIAMKYEVFSDLSVHNHKHTCRPAEANCVLLSSLYQSTS